nr:HTH domain-containing protein [uncultured Campylobacter sp.]
MEKYTFSDLAYDVLNNSRESLKSQEIWQKAVELGFDKKLNSSGRTPKDSLAALLYTDVKKQDSKFIVLSRQPTRFGLKGRKYQEITESKKEIDSVNCVALEQKVKKEKFKERDLHPLLVKFLFESPLFDVYAKTIYHERSIKEKGGQNEWLHPDVVGVHFGFNDFAKTSFDLLKKLNVINHKLYSFEIKISLDWSNLKSSYFQAVSNSSWANEGYLVVFDFDENDEIMQELRRLNTNFGIGLIKLDTEILSSKILIASKQRQIDSVTLDILTEKNPNFKEFLDDIVKDIQINEVGGKIAGNYDDVFDDEEIQKHIKDKKMETNGIN